MSRMVVRTKKTNWSKNTLMKFQSLVAVFSTIVVFKHKIEFKKKNKVNYKIILIHYDQNISLLPPSPYKNGYNDCTYKINNDTVTDTMEPTFSKKNQRLVPLYSLL
jgi:hypothetical protein